MRTQDIDTAWRRPTRSTGQRSRGSISGYLPGLFAEIFAEPAEGQNAETIASPGRDQGRHPRRILFVIGSSAVAIVAAILVVLGAIGGPAEKPAPAYGAELVRFAQSTPLLLLEGPGWRVQNVDEYSNGEGQLEFVTGKPIPSESIRITGSEETGQRESECPGRGAPAESRIELARRIAEECAQRVEMETGANGIAVGWAPQDVALGGGRQVDHCAGPRHHGLRQHQGGSFREPTWPWQPPNEGDLA